MDALDDEDANHIKRYQNALANKSMHGSTSSPKLSGSNEPVTSPPATRPETAAADTKSKSSMYILSLSNLFSGKKVNSKRLNDKEISPAPVSTAATNNDEEFEKAHMKAKIKNRKQTGRRRKLSFSNLFISANARMNTKKINDKSIDHHPVSSVSAKNSVERQLKPDDKKNNNSSPQSFDKKSPSFPKFDVSSFRNLLLSNRSRSNSSDNSDTEDNKKNNKSNSNSKTSLDKHSSGSKSMSKTELFKSLFVSMIRFTSRLVTKRGASRC